MTQGVTGDTASRRRSTAALLSLADVTAQRRLDASLVTVLDRVSFDVWPGEVVAVVGERRSGKTSLLRVACGMESPREGVVRVGGRRLTGVSGGARARHARAVGYMPKQLLLADGTRMVDHVALPLVADRVPLATATARAHEALERAGASDLADAAPGDLSPGQQALVALARALVRRPALLLADEPGSTAQPEERERLLRLLQTIARETADLSLVLTSRDETGTTGATRVLRLCDGQLTSTTHGRVIPLPARAH
jgi:ABC-type methionine transport system ATPase subunit